MSCTRRPRSTGPETWRKFINVTLPMVSPTMFFNSILACISAVTAFETAYVGTGGGPAYATWLYSLNMYQTTFVNFDMGYGAALAWILFIVLSVVTYTQFRLANRWVYYAGGEG